MTGWTEQGVRLVRIGGTDEPASIATAELVALYDAVGWTVYTADAAALARAVEGSSHVVTARQGDRLVGLARCVSDDVSIVYVQDILVHPSARRLGLGRALVTDCLKRYAHVRQKVLLTDDRPEQHAFYTSLGFRNTRDLEHTRLNAYVRIEGAELT